MIRSDDPERDYAQWETEQYLYEMACPVCNDCGEHITDEHYWEFHGVFYCESCLDNHKYYVDDYVNK